MKIFQKRSSVILYIIGCIGFVIFGLVLLHVYYHHPEYIDIRDRMLTPILAWASIIFFGIIGLPVITMTFIKPKHMLEISDKGFYSDSWGFIEWDNVYGINLINIRGTKIIMFNIKNISDKHKYRQKINRLLTGYNFDIALSGTGANVEEVYNIMLNHLNKSF